MNKYIKIFLFVLASLMILSSCIKTKFEEPDKATYNPGLTATTTISDLKNMYTGGLTLLDTDIIICGTVIANDKTGNFYKQIVIQDSTAGIAIDIDLYEMHNSYHIGDLVYIKCNGLYLGQYGGIVKLGSIYQGDIGRITEAQVPFYIFKSDGGFPIEPQELSLASPNTDLINKVVIINNAQFSLSALGNTYADGEYKIDGEYNIEDCDGNTMLVRTSGFADFARDTIPSGNGRMIGVLGMFNGEFQLMIRDPRELDFTGDRCGAIFEETFEGNLGQFSQFSVIGDNQVWTYSSQFDCAVMSGYDAGTDYQNEDWLISPAMNFSGYSNLVLNFRHALNYITSLNDVEVYASSDYTGTGNPNDATWTKLTGIIYPPGNNWTWTDSGDVSLSAFAGQTSVYIAFKYKSTASNSSTWEIDRISVSAL
jgi:hypothetical protein